MSTSQTPTKIIGYGVIVRRTTVHTAPFLCMDSECKDTYEQAMNEALALRGDDVLIGIFAMDARGNFTTIHNSDDIEDAVEAWRRSQLTDEERRGDDADTEGERRMDERKNDAA